MFELVHVIKWWLKEFVYVYNDDGMELVLYVCIYDVVDDDLHMWCIKMCTSLK